jgi:Putative auto-transporter adhesin, head GIN domain
MRTSQKALLGAVGFAVLLVVGLLVSGRLVIETLRSGDYAEDGRPANAAVLNGTSADLPLRDFTTIDARGLWNIELVRGDDFAVHVTYPEESAARIDVRVEGTRLVLGTRRGPWRLFGHSDDHFTARVVMPELQAVEVSGASDLDLDGFTGDALRLVVSGAAQIDAHRGRFDSLTLIVSGAGRVDLRDMPAVDAQIVMSGAGNIDLTMQGGELTGTVSGAGKIRYHGTVSRQNLIMSGFSSAEHVD